MSGHAETTASAIAPKRHAIGRLWVLSTTVRVSRSDPQSHGGRGIRCRSGSHGDTCGAPRVTRTRSVPRARGRHAPPAARSEVWFKSMNGGG